MDTFSPIILINIIIYCIQQREIQIYLLIINNSFLFKLKFSSKNKILFLRYPFNWKTPLGYITIICYQAAVTYLTASILFYSMIMTVAHCMFVVAFVSDVKNDIRTLNEVIQIEIDEKKRFSATAINKIKKLLSENILFHVNAKQLSKHMFYIV